jgi:hypothetical protein
MEKSDGICGMKPPAEESFSHRGQNGPPALGRVFHRLLKGKGQALAKRAHHRSDAANLTEQASTCETPSLVSTESGLTFSLTSQASTIERHVSFQDDLKSDRSAAQPHPANGAARCGSETRAPLRTSLRRRSKLATDGATPEMELMASTCLPLVAAVLWFLCCCIHDLVVSFEVLDHRLMPDIRQAFVFLFLYAWLLCSMLERAQLCTTTALEHTMQTIYFSC